MSGVTPLRLPAELADLLRELGYVWPKTDEVRLLELGQAWERFAGAVLPLVAEADAAVRTVVGSQLGDDVDAVAAYWDGRRPASSVLGRVATGSPVVGAATIVCAGVVVALKAHIVVQLAVLAAQIGHAVARAPATFGVSLTEIPVYQRVTDVTIDYLFGQAVETVLGEALDAG